MNEIEGKIFDLIDLFVKKERDYEKVNTKIKEISSRDFPQRIQFCDDEILSAIFDLFDKILDEKCGLYQLASYYAFESVGMKGGGSIGFADGKEFKLRTIDDLKEIYKYAKQRKKSEVKP